MNGKPTVGKSCVGSLAVAPAASSPHERMSCGRGAATAANSMALVSGSRITGIPVSQLHPAQRPEVAVRAEDCRPWLCVPDRPLQVAGAVEARQRLEGNVLDGVAAVLALRVEDRVKRSLLW